MLVFSDVISGDQMLSDSYPIREVDDVVYEVDCKYIQTRQGVDVDIGANPSAEEAEEGLEDGIIQVIDVIDAFRLQPTSFDKRDYLAYLKIYMKAIESYLWETDPGRVQEFEKNVSESMNVDGMVALFSYREDGAPFFTFWKDGLHVVDC
ncbi:Translationally-controlled tumor protein [Penicillium mononematosum]|uniref:Translationally-controlled tumor protein n=1 Tax=Penicillium mononematosum TaxID=268346 RepID=UPI002546EB3D|nr:Translationally-controlled tumor protein [Penicillium mononematosum]KAJ6184338.1 Translationally-controlled tumor protein [Penicillium mononematosum]